MRNKLSIIFLLLGGVFFMVGATFMSVNSTKHEDKKKNSSNEETKKSVSTYMPVLLKIEDKDSSVYILPNMPLGDSKISNVDDKIYDMLEKYPLVVQYDNSKLNQLDYIKNFVLNEEDYLDNYISDGLKEKLFNFSNSHSKYNYDDYKHYNIGFNYTVLDNLAYYEAGLTTDSFLNDMLEKYRSNPDNVVLVLERESDSVKYINDPSKETFSSLMDKLIDNFDDVKKKYKNNYKNYLDGNVNELNKFYNSISSDDEYYKAKITDRNDRYILFIEEHLKINKEVLIVLDSENVFGDNGVYKTLESKDYAVRIIK